MTRRCRALCLSAPASNQGKTLVAAALARHWRNQGLRVRVFKAGPDFLDPMILERASGATVYNLDGWMGGMGHCRALLYEAAAEADVILLEGVMGLFDGPCSSADLAAAFGLPVAAVIDAAGMGQSFGAVALGLARYRPELTFRGALANGVASPRHEAMVKEGMPDGIAYLGGFPRQPRWQLPSRHLGLVQAAELAGLDELLDEAAEAVGKTGLAEAALPVDFSSGGSAQPPALLRGVRIA
ncbi:nucleotide-binding protein, partial [Methylogaea oryzae]